MIQDFLGQNLEKGDRVVTYATTWGGGTELIIARVRRLTKTRVYLESWETNDLQLHKEYTMPNKVIKMVKVQK